MKINNIPYLIKEGFRSIFTHGLMSFASVCVTVACLVIVGTFSLLMVNLNIMVENLNETTEVLVYVDSAYTEAEARSVGTKINLIENVQLATFIPREQALESFINEHDQDTSSFQGVDPNDLRHRFKVVLEDNARMEETVAYLMRVPGVVKIAAEYELAEGFSTVSTVVEMLSLAIIVVLLVVSLLIISNTVKLSMYDRKDEIAIMKMVGATNGFIRMPFVVQGFILGTLGAAIAFGVEWWMYNAAIDWIADVDALGLFTFVPFEQLLVPMIITFASAGLIVGVFGSVTSIRKFLNV